jgi:hypothetical protein
LAKLCHNCDAKFRYLFAFESASSNASCLNIPILGKARGLRFFPGNTRQDNQLLVT